MANINYLDIVTKFNHKCQFVLAGLILVIIWSEKGLDQMGSCALLKRCYAEYPPHIPKERNWLRFALGEYIHVNKMEKYKMLTGSCYFVVFWTRCFILLYALLFSWKASCL